MIIESPSVDAADSPCVNICELDTDFVCKGCGRSIEEILKWQEYTAEQQKAVLDRIFGANLQSLAEGS